jgi:hypothetical protein
VAARRAAQHREPVLSRVGGDGRPGFCGERRPERPRRCIRGRVGRAPNTLIAIRHNP